MSRKRSAHVGFSVLTLSATAAIAGCGQGEQQQAQQTQVYSSVAQCRAQNAGAACDQAWQASVGEHQKTAPQFAQQSACEAQYGQGQCQAMGGEHRGGNVFIPVMAGFMLGRMMSNGGGGGGYFGHPVYTGRNGGLFSGGARIGDVGGNAGRLPASVSAPVTESGSIASRGVTTRGGFGPMAGFRGGFGG